MIVARGTSPTEDTTESMANRMATRPVFLAKLRNSPALLVKPVDFTWHPGLSAAQKKRSVRSLHEAACRTLRVTNLLEISTKSEDPVGVALSAFNLSFTTQKHKLTLTVESAFQGSKVFEDGGPFTDLYTVDSKSAKIDRRTRSSGALVAFRFFGSDWPIRPITAFYDWLYLNALAKNPDISARLFDYEGFTDIEFNPEKSLNCQAYSAALYVYLSSNGLLDRALSGPSAFLDTVEQIPGYGIASHKALDFLQTG